MNAHRPSCLVRRLIRLGITLLLALLVAGCDTVHQYSLTYKVWNRDASPSCQPAQEPRLEVFASQTQPDVLVIYDALDERADKILRRAYFLHTNEARIASRQKPFYVEPSLAMNMNAVPIVATTNLVKETGLVARYPVNTDNGPGFELYRDGRKEGAYALPSYGEGMGTTARVVLTPLAAAGDTVMVGVVVGVVAAIGWLYAGCPPFGNHY